MKITEAVYKKFHHRQIAHRQEIIAFLKGNTTRANTAIQWLLNNGKALAIKTGLYYFKRPEEWYAEHVEVNPLILAAHAHLKGVVGYHAALKCYGAAYSESRAFQVAVDESLPRVPGRFDFQNSRYEFYRTNLSFGIASSIISDVRVRHFSKERILLEGLIFADRFLGISEFLQSIEGFAWIDLNALMSMLKHYPLSSLSMRLGWLLEKNRERWHVSNEVFKKLERYRPKSKVQLLKKKTRDTILVKRWNLMVPRAVVNMNET